MSANQFLTSTRVCPSSGAEQIARAVAVTMDLPVVVYAILWRPGGHQGWCSVARVELAHPENMGPRWCIRWPNRGCCGAAPPPPRSCVHS